MSVIIINASFKIPDFSPIVLFQQLWNKPYYCAACDLQPVVTSFFFFFRAIAGYYFHEGEYVTLYLSPFASFDFQLTCELPLLDLIFVLDTSNIRSRTGLENMKRMFQSVINLPPAINDATGKRVAAVTYHSSTIEKFFDYNR